MAEQVSPSKDLTQVRLEAARDWVLAAPRRSCTAVFLATLAVYLLTAHYFTGQISDTQAVIWPAYEFVHHGTFRLDHVPNLPPGNEWFFHANGHLVAGRMMGPILAGVPLTALLAWTPLNPADLNALNAAVFSAIAMTALFATFRRLVPTRAAVAGFVIVAFGTPVWTIAAGELWPQTVDILFICLMFYALSRNRVGWAGIALAPALLSRPHLALIALIMGVGLSIGRRSLRPLIGFGVPAATSFALLYPWNHFIYGRWALLGTYSNKVGVISDNSVSLHSLAWSGLQTAFSPYSGLLTWSPVMILAIYWMARRPRYAPGWTGLALVSGIVYQVVQLRLDTWTGGAGFYGSRLTLELVVLAAPMAVVCYQPWAAGHRFRRFSASLLAGIGIAIFFVGAVLDEYRPGGLYHTFWTTFYPEKVVLAAGRQGNLISSIAVLGLAVFALERYFNCLRAPKASIAAPRDPSDDDVASEVGARQLTSP